MDPFSLAWFTMSAIFTGASAFNKMNAADARIRSLDLQSKQSTIRHQQEVLSNYDILENVIASQTAQASAKGVSLSSPSLEAIERDTYNKVAKENKNLKLEEDFYQQGIKIEKKAVKQTLFTSLFGDIVQTGFNAAEIYKSASKKG